MHADPHGGNMLLTPDMRIAYLVRPPPGGETPPALPAPLTHTHAHTKCTHASPGRGLPAGLWSDDVGARGPPPGYAPGRREPHQLRVGQRGARLPVSPRFSRPLPDLRRPARPPRRPRAASRRLTRRPLPPPAAQAEGLDEMGMLPASASRPQVAAALEATMGPSVQPGSPALQLGPLMAALLGVAYKFRFHLPPYYTLVMRSLTSLEGIALSVDPTFYVFEATYPFVLRRFLSDPHPTVRGALRSLLLTPEGRVKWDRVDEVAPYFTRFSDAARAAVAQETGGGARGGAGAEAEEDGGAEDTASVGKILLSRRVRGGRPPRPTHPAGCPCATSFWSVHTF